MWGANRAKFEPLLHEIQDGNEEIPLVFKGMALRWDEVTRLKATIRDECEYVNSESYREQPEKHKYCPRD